VLHLVAQRIEAKVEPQIEHNHPKLHQTIPILFFKIISRNGLYRRVLKKNEGQKNAPNRFRALWQWQHTHYHESRGGGEIQSRY
jgi:hypothetical protein